MTRGRLSRLWLRLDGDVAFHLRQGRGRLLAVGRHDSQGLARYRANGFAVEGIERSSVCLRYSARKTDGQYAPSKDSLVVFRDGRLDRIVDTPRELREACKDAVYQPFPELERLR